ncbi:MAG TPA: SDR family oxidoreductase [Casimicrobiaceae bacterium]|nr:SDR family oxidoreductase [Casimicrobiaceae bacterium]
MNVFVTGASAGIGAALARVYAARGAAIGLFARRSEALAALAASLPGVRCACYTGDVREPAALASAASDFLDRFGAADIVIANAGVSVGTSTEHAADNASFRALIDTNLLGILHTFQPFVAPMRAAGRGKLVGIASVAGFRGLPGAGAYSASKAAAISYLESLRVELFGSGVEVITICPGFIATAMTADNPYRMPFLLSTEKAARLIAGAIDRGRRFYVLPWQMAWLGRALRVLPRPVYDKLLSRRPRKPRAVAGDGR